MCLQRLVCILLLFSFNSYAIPARAQEQRDERRNIVVNSSLIAPVKGAPATIEDLRSRIEEILRQPVLAPAHVALKVVSLDTGKVIYEENAGKLMQPASNMKLYAVAAALDRLSPEYRFKTSVYARARPEAAGVIKGDLTVYGRGDPTYSLSFTGGNDYYKAIDELAAQIVAAGVRRVEGDLVGDDTYFTGRPPVAPGWGWQDSWYYGVEVSALSINDNAFDVMVKPGTRVGDECRVVVEPSTTLITTVNRATTAPKGTRSALKISRRFGENVVEISGTMALDGDAHTQNLPVLHPALMFVTMLRTSLERQGVTIKGRTRAVESSPASAVSGTVTTQVEIAARQSPPLGRVAAHTLKPSQNLYAEILLRTLGMATDETAGKQTSIEAGHKAVKNFLSAAGIDASKFVLGDAAGISRGNLISAEATLQLLKHMSRHRYAEVFREALPVGGVDGTLRNRMRGTAAAGNVRAKTGTLSTATSLSGYVTGAGGERLVFSLMINNPAPNTDPRASFTDPLAALLASFTGRTQP